MCTKHLTNQRVPGCGCCECNKISEKQSETNRQITVPVAAKNNYELALESGSIPPDTTLEQYLNMPVQSAFTIQELGENV